MQAEGKHERDNERVAFSASWPNSLYSLFFAAAEAGGGSPGAVPASFSETGAGSDMMGVVKKGGERCAKRRGR